MWTSIMAKIIKFIPAIGKVKDFVLKNWKWLRWVLLGIGIVIAIGWIVYNQFTILKLENRINTLTTENASLKVDILNASITSLVIESASELKDITAQSKDELLKRCYEEMNNSDSLMTEIDTNMAVGKEGTPLTEIKKEKTGYEPITQEQNTAGINTINNTLATVK